MIKYYPFKVKEEITMKKVFAIMMIGILAVSMTACGQAAQSGESQETTAAAEETTVETPEEAISGGYIDAASPVVTDEVKALLDKETQELTGVSYVPVAYVSSQVVAGMNHLVLCKATTVTADPITTYALVTIYEDLNGGAEITDIRNSDAQAPADSEEPMDGAAAEPASPEVTADAKDALTKATELLTGATYEPVALLSTQVVNGTNYTMLCKITTVTEKPQTDYAVVTVYANSDGTAEITQTYEFASAQS